MSTLNRRRFVAQTAGGLFFISASAALARAEPVVRAHGESVTSYGGQAVPERPPALAPATVNEFVRKAHADLAGTKAMLAEQPALLNATWDWGGGDFETGLGGAGHMGNREIAEFLIAQGARLDIFVAAMLGKLDVVRAMLGAWPGLLQSRGPHGIPLLRHAHMGGEPAKPVVDYLISLGAA
jgi:hypothetical protein